MSKSSRDGVSRWYHYSIMFTQATDCSTNCSEENERIMKRLIAVDDNWSGCTRAHVQTKSFIWSKWQCDFPLHFCWEEIHLNVNTSWDILYTQHQGKLVYDMQKAHHKHPRNDLLKSLWSQSISQVMMVWLVIAKGTSIAFECKVIIGSDYF